METRTCKICKEEKTAENFPLRRYKKKNGEISEYKSYTCGICSGKYATEWHKKNPEKSLNARYKREFGITYEQYQVFLEDQDFRCAICRKPESTKNFRANSPKRLAVDHCHKEGIVRGLLCAHCNQGLGHFLDSPLLLKRAVEYVLKER